MLVMVIERFKNRDAAAVYRRLRTRGRMVPDNLVFVGSWVEVNWDRCFQLMECARVEDLDVWAREWRDLVDFEFVPVIPGKEAAAHFAA
jgi:hypothetical protein